MGGAELPDRPGDATTDELGSAEADWALDGAAGPELDGLAVALERGDAAAFACTAASTVRRTTPGNAAVTPTASPAVPTGVAGLRPPAGDRRTTGVDPRPAGPAVGAALDAAADRAVENAVGGAADRAVEGAAADPVGRDADRAPRGAAIDGATLGVLGFVRVRAGAWAARATGTTGMP